MKLINVWRAQFLAGLCVVSIASAQSWIPTSAISTNWGWLVSSADGTKLVALNGNDFYSTTNSGATWQKATNQPVLSNAEWSALAGSADGVKCVATAFYSSFPVGGNGGIFVPTNSGMSWARMTNLFSMSPVACSTDGNEMVAAGSSIYTSTNSGTLWVKTGAPNASWSALTSSADGTKLFAAIFGGGIYLSTNSGGTWVITGAPSKNWFNMVSSADASRLAAVDYHHAIFSSTNAGATWVSNSLPVAPWHNIASSAAGNKLVAVATNGFIYTSTNFGVTWYSNNVPTNSWSASASSADGGKLTVAANRGGIYTSYTQLTPSLNLVMLRNNLVFSWDVPSTNYVIQQTAGVTDINWLNLTNAPILNTTNLRYEMILPITGDIGFYRLKTP